MVKGTEEKNMKEKILAYLVAMALEKLTSDELKEWADKGIDLIEEKIKASPTQTDDLVALPILSVIRVAFSIPDKD